MNNYQSITSLLVADLTARSAGASGRILSRKIEQYGFDLDSASSPLDWALRLRSDDLRQRHDLEALLEWTADDVEFRLLAIVALTPKLEEIARRVGWLTREDGVAEIVAQATAALRWTREVEKGRRVAFVVREVAKAVSAERSSLRRHYVASLPIDDGFDVAEATLDDGPTAVSRLRRVLELRVIDDLEYDVVVSTRSGLASLTELATRFGLSYDALRMRRSRAETRIRRFYGVRVSR